MKSANVSDLKAKLSSYLAEVRRGGTILVYDRSTPIARLVPFKEEPDDFIVIEPTAPPSGLKRIKGVRPKKRIDLDQVLREMRGDR
jgi:prevent-host-death family protein